MTLTIFNFILQQSQLTIYLFYFPYKIIKVKNQTHEISYLIEYKVEHKGWHK